MTDTTATPNSGDPKSKPAPPVEPAYQSPTTAGLKSIRDTAKWLIAAFGATGGALIASVQLTDLGHLSGSHKTEALVGFSLAIVGVMVALLAAASILTAQVVTLEELATGRQRTRWRSKKSLAAATIGKDVLAGFGSIQEVQKLYSESSELRHKAYLGELDAWYESKPQAEQQSLNDQFQLAVRRLREANPIVQLLLDIGLFEKVRQRWTSVVLPLVTVGVLVAGFGAGLFALADSVQASSSAPVAARPPLVGEMALNGMGQSDFKSILGPGCQLTDVAVEVFASSAKGWDVETADPLCNLERLTIPTRDATITACRPFHGFRSSESARKASTEPMSSGTRVVEVDASTATTTTAPSRGPPPDSSGDRPVCAQRFG
jgi:hypothetical protein